MRFSNVAVTAASRSYLAVLALLVLPVYLRLLGQEAYGLVTLFFVLQVWLQLLDCGLSATLAREAARHRAGALTTTEFGQLLRAMEIAFLLTAFAASVLLMLAAAPLTQHWLRLERLPAEQAGSAIELMALGIGLRLLGEPYRGLMAGFERLGLLACCNTVFGTLRWLGVVPVLGWMGADASTFFVFQLLVSALETLVVQRAARRLVPRSAALPPALSLQPLRRVRGFSLTMLLASVLWVVHSQLDKVVLSGVLTLSDFGAFSLAASAAASVLLATGALADTLVPRLTALQASGAAVELQALYRRATRWCGAVAWPAAALLASQAERVLWVWTADHGLASRLAPVLALYALGNAALAVSAFPYYLQLARGELRLHLLGTGLMTALLLPALIWASAQWGAAGAAAVWLGANVLFLVAWTPVAHAKFAPGLHRRWLLHDVVPSAFAAAAAAWACRALPWPDDRLGAGLMLLLAGGLMSVAVALAGTWMGGRWAGQPVASG